MYKPRLYVVIGIALVLAGCSGEQQSKSAAIPPRVPQAVERREVTLSLLPDNDPEYKALAAFASEWRAAVLAKDDNRLEDLMGPHMSSFCAELGREGSPVRRSYYGRTHSDWAYFRSSRLVRPFVLVASDDGHDPRRIYVCWGRVGKYSWPMALNRWLVEGSDALCEVVAADESGRWRFYDPTDRLGW